MALACCLFMVYVGLFFVGKVGSLCELASKILIGRDDNGTIFLRIHIDLPSKKFVGFDSK